MDGAVPLLFTENETNNQRLFGTANPTPRVKDGIGDYLLHGRADAVSLTGPGTKVAAHHLLDVPGGGAAVLRFRLTDRAPFPFEDPLARFEETFEARQREADEFYRSVTPASATEDETRVMRQGLAGMLCGKQYYFFDANKWLEEHGVDPFATSASTVRNREWGHMTSRRNSPSGRVFSYRTPPAEGTATA